MTKRFLVRALVFSLAAFVPLAIADAIWGIGFDPSDLRHRLAGMHWLFHVGTLVLSTLGAWLGFQTIGGQGPSILIAVGLGVLFGLVSIVAAPAALVFTDELGCAFWLFVGAMFATVGASPFVKPVDGHPPPA